MRAFCEHWTPKLFRRIRNLRPASNLSLSIRQQCNGGKLHPATGAFRGAWTALGASILFLAGNVAADTDNSVVNVAGVEVKETQNTDADRPTEIVKPIDIEADRFTVYLADEKAIWQGNVVASQGNYTFRTSLLTLHLEQIGDTPEEDNTTADNGHSSQRNAISLSAQQVNYNLQEGKVVGQGNSELRRGEEIIRADQITYLVADQIAHGVPEAHGRVSVKFYGNPNRPVIPGSLGTPTRGAE